MIVKFIVQNFGSIKEKQTISFEANNSNDLEDSYIIHGPNGIRLLKMILLYGANASGKTMLLNAIEFLRKLVLEPEEIKTGKIDFNPFLFDDITSGQNSLLAMDFIQNDVRYYYEVEFNGQSVVREELYFFNPKKAVIFKRTTDQEKQLTDIKFGSKIKKDKLIENTLASNTLWNNTVLGGFLKTNIYFYELKEVTDWFNDYLRPLIRPNTNLNNYITRSISNKEINKAHVVGLLKRADFNISDIHIKEEERDLPDGLIELIEKDKRNNPEILNRLRNKNRVIEVNLELEHTLGNNKFNLPFELESLGTKRYYGFSGILALLLKKTVAFPIDELESSLHPDLFVHFILIFLLNSKKSQVLATTHNREILNNKNIFRNDAIWFADKGQLCFTELYSLAHFDSKIIRDTSSIYNAYKTGKLGGVPNLGDYLIELSD